MKITNYILSFTFLLVSLCAEAQQLRKETFDLLNQKFLLHTRHRNHVPIDFLP